MQEQKVYIVDDEEPIRDAISMLLDSVALQCETFVSAKEFLETYSQNMCGCIVSDVRMARMSGLMLQKHLSELDCKLPIIFITGHGDVEMAVQALKEGAFDFIQKPFHRDGLLDCINLALEKNAEDSRQNQQNEQLKERLQLLTNRESEVLDLLLEGKPSKQIGRELGISPRTVDVHRQNILNKFNASSVACLIRDVSTLKERN